MSRSFGTKGGGAWSSMFSTPGAFWPLLPVRGRGQGDGSSRQSGIERQGGGAVTATTGPRRIVEDEDFLTPEDEAAMRAQWRAIERLYREESPNLARYFERRVPSDDVKDFVQESFRRILKHRPERPGSFIGRTAVNLVREARRGALRRRLDRHEPLDDCHLVGPDPHPQLDARDALARVDHAVRMLKPRTRDIFLMSRIEGRSYAEIGERIGMSEEGVKKQVAKAMDVLRRRVGDI